MHKIININGFESATAETGTIKELQPSLGTSRSSASSTIFIYVRMDANFTGCEATERRTPKTIAFYLVVMTEQWTTFMLGPVYIADYKKKKTDDIVYSIPSMQPKHSVGNCT